VHQPLNRLVLAFAVLVVTAGLGSEALGATEPLLANVRQLTFEGRRAGEGYFSHDGKRMIFQSERDAKNPFYQIYLMDLETGDVERVSTGLGRTTCAWIHPSGTKVLYSSTHADPEAREKMKKEMDERKSGKQRRYSWNYDPAYEIYAQQLKGGERINLTNALGYDAEASYSPDGKRVAFASNRRAYGGRMSAAERKMFEHDPASMMDIYHMNADGSGVERLTAAPGYDGGPFFSADGRHITWRRFALNGASAEIYTMDLATRTEKRLTNMRHMSWAPYFHPSGDYLIFASNQQGYANFELFIVDAAGKKPPARVTFTDGFDGLPVFSPDGGRLSWTSKRSANKTSQIFLADWDDAGARRMLGLAAPTAARSTAPAPALEGTAAPIRAEDARKHVRRLSADDMAGRLTGTEGERRATEYVMAAFQQMGLAPGAPGGAWYQPFAFTAGAVMGPNNHLRVPAPAAGPAPVLDRDWRPLALTRTGEIEPAEVVFAGYGLVAPGTEKIPAYDSYGEMEVRGKWVMVFRYLPEDVMPEWRRHWLHYADLAYKASVAKRHGARGMIVVTGPKAAAASRLVELKGDTATSATSLAGITISDELASRWLAMAGKDLAQVQEGLDQGKVVSGFALPKLRLGATLDIVRKKKHGRNVLARLHTGAAPGAAPLVLGAHIDHLGHGQASGSLAGAGEQGEIHPGADDNASGVAALLEIAQYLAHQQRAGKLGARRDILFAAWSGEALGTLGSSRFVEDLAGSGYLKGKVAAYLNMDMIGHLRDKLYLQGSASSSAWPREIERRNVPVGLAIATQGDPYLPTDSTPFYMKGVPVLNAFTGAHEDYSTPRDTADKLNYEGIRDIARLMAGFARSLARAEAAPDYQEVARKKGGMARKHLRAYLGTIPAYGQDDSLKGVKLQGAVKGAPAEAAGVKKNDVLVGLAGVEIETIHDFMNALGGLKAGEATEMIVRRGGARVTLQVVPAARQ